MTTVLKLGGSVITEKKRQETLDGAAIETVADDIAWILDADTKGPAIGDLVIVHGGGSFGHPHAKRHGVSVDVGTRDYRAVTDVHGAMTTLNRLILSQLHERDVPAVPVHPFSAAVRSGDHDLTMPTGQIEAMLDAEFVPVIHGDLVAHRGKGVTVVSGDELVVALSEKLPVERVGLCSAEPGVLDRDGDLINSIQRYEDVASDLGESAATDVTGGMAGKVTSLLELSVPAHIFDRSSLRSFLAGETPGTRIG